MELQLVEVSQVRLTPEELSMAVLTVGRQSPQARDSRELPSREGPSRGRRSRPLRLLELPIRAGPSQVQPLARAPDSLEQLLVVGPFRGLL